MIAIAERTVPALAPPPARTTSGEARALADGFLRYESACWRGERGAAAFQLRLSAYWQPDMPPAPVAAPDAVSPHGAAGRGILWYEIGQEVLGYIPGLRGGYRLPGRAVPQLARRLS